MTHLSKNELIVLQNRGLATLEKLVTKHGIYASTQHGWSGEFHAWFGRDSAITADLIFAAQQYNRNSNLAGDAYADLEFLIRWQGRADNAKTGESHGKMTHEVRKLSTTVDFVQHSAGTNLKPWYVDPADGLLKNWDSCDSTPLWIISIARWHKLTGAEYSPIIIPHLRLALEWCLANLKQYGGFAGFRGADLQPHRLYSGLHNQGWKDSVNIYQYQNGELAKQPIKDVFVNGAMWSALRYGAEIFRDQEGAFAETLQTAARNLKKRFNHVHSGFLMLDKKTNLHFYAQALDRYDARLTQQAADVGMCLWAYYEDECIIDKSYMSEVVTRLVLPDFLNTKAGIRNYSLGTFFGEGTQYHGSSHTYWPFVSALIANGLAHFNYDKEAQAVNMAFLQGVSEFQTCIELFVEDDMGSLHPWHHPLLRQPQSAADQAWTAAAVYYGTSYLLRGL